MAEAKVKAKAKGAPKKATAKKAAAKKVAAKKAVAKSPPSRPRRKPKHSLRPRPKRAAKRARDRLRVIRGVKRYWLA